MKKLILVILTSISFCAAASDTAKEIEKALSLEADPSRGEQVYELCATCHLKTGWGKKDGSFPVLAGQHASVLIKQLADIQARNRENPTMFPFSDAETIGGVQAVADVAAYINHLPATSDNGKGDGKSVDEGNKLYAEKCAGCHGKTGEGNAAAFFPRIKGQHFNYLARQMRWMRDGFRKNGNPAMVELVKTLSDEDIDALADSISRF